MTREGPTGVGSVLGPPTCISVTYRSRGMTSLDPDIDGGLPWFRGWFRTLEPGLEPGRKQPRNHLVPGVVPTLPPTLEPTSRKRNPPWNRLHGRETRPPSKNVMSQSVQRSHPFPSHDEDLACVTMGNFFVPIELCCVFLRESLPSLPTNKTLLLFPRKAVGALGHHLATAGTLAPQPPTHRRSGT